MEQDKYQYDFEGNLQIVEMNENRREVLDAMRELTNAGTGKLIRVMFANILTYL